MIKLIGVAIVILGFALKLDNIAIILVAGFATGLVGGMDLVAILQTIGSSFVANRGMCIFIIIMLVTGTLERNGLREMAAKLIGKIKNATAGMVIGAYGVLRLILGAFNVSLGGTAGFVRPVVMPMATGAIETKHGEPNEDHLEEIKGMSAGMENTTWFFGQVLFIGGSGALLVQSTLKGLGYETNLVDLAKVEIPVAIFALVVASVLYYLKDKRLSKTLYGQKK
ncbi:MAG: DUF969 domain-containing protein [Spirochaetae bacterium HGW-Spirochaetae-3]|jgi:uncharacterized membrane protein|nr:MAG: DUF969 domain-containing protein [Spirochaetae bacterium HGW-Spirochaetae-3]